MTAEPTVRLVELFPHLVDVLGGALAARGRHRLAASCRSVEVVDRCRCDAEGCATFYVAPKPSGPFGPGHENLVISEWPTLLVVDVVDDELRCIELVDEPKMAARLRSVLP